jgi:hypothetical protein
MHQTFDEDEYGTRCPDNFTKAEKVEYMLDLTMFNSLCMKSSVFMNDSCNGNYTVKFVQNESDSYIRTEAFLYCGDETLCWLSGIEVDWLYNCGEHVEGYDEHKVGFVFKMDKVNNV